MICTKIGVGDRNDSADNSKERFGDPVRAARAIACEARAASCASTVTVFSCIKQLFLRFKDWDGGIWFWDPAPEVCAIAHNHARSARSELCEHHYHFSASISRFHNLETKRAEAESLRALHSVVPAFLLWRETMLENRENCCSMYLSYLGWGDGTIWSLLFGHLALYWDTSQNLSLLHLTTFFKKLLLASAERVVMLDNIRLFQGKIP